MIFFGCLELDSNVFKERFKQLNITKFCLIPALSNSEFQICDDQNN